MAEHYRVYWQPGCSSCLRAKEFLKAQGIAYESINVREVDGAMAVLARLGAKSVPVVAAGERFVLAQDLDELAAFVGGKLERRWLSPEALVGKLDLVLAATQRYLRQLPDERLHAKMAGRERTCLDLAYHIFVIPLAFLDAARGGALTFDYFERLAPAEMTTGAPVAQFGQGVRQDFAAWWGEAAKAAWPETVRTYYGTQPTHAVLERTAWHAAQHCRQVMAVLEQAGIAPDGALGPRELDGLPLPDEVYDDEVRAVTA